MAAAKCYKNTEKGLNQGFYCGSRDANWGYKASKEEDKYQGPHNGYAMAYSESECYSQIEYPSHGMSRTKTAYGTAETWDEYGRSYGSQKPQNENAMSKTHVHDRGNGFRNQANSGIPQIQAHGSSHHTSPRKHQGNGYGYGGSTPANQKNSGEMSHHFSNHTSHGYDETSGCGKYKNNGMAHNQAHLRGGGYEADKGDHSVKGLLRKIKDGISGNNRRGDTGSDCTKDDDYEMRKVWISKAI
ncbi:hypothetical protein DITRI_Ditri04bG0138400 [Diplodiscus trichospermus]